MRDEQAFVPRLADIVEASERVRTLLQATSMDAFEADWQTRWLVERGVEIISEASRHLPDALKQRHPDIPWRKVAGIGNILRHSYESVSPPVLWTLVREDLPRLERACQAELELGRPPTPPARS